MLQIKNTLGGGKPEGLYAWKKSVGTGVVKETPSTERYYFTTSQSESVTIYYSSSYTYDDGDFVLTNPSEINIALGAHNAIEANLYFMMNTSRGNVMLKSSSGSNNQRTVIYNQKSGLFAHCPDSSYPFYICNDTYEFLDYIVSDKETAYPDGGEKDGYWYERVGEGLDIDLSKLGCTKFEQGSFTPSSDEISITVPHSLGVYPKFVLVYAPSVTSGYGYVGYASALIKTTAVKWWVFMGAGSATSAEEGNGEGNSNINFYSGSTAYYYKKGAKYNYIIFG